MNDGTQSTGNPGYRERYAAHLRAIGVPDAYIPRIIEAEASIRALRRDAMRWQPDDNYDDPDEPGQ